MNIKIKKYQWDGNGEILELKILGFIEIKNKRNKDSQPNKVRIVTEPLKGFSGAATITIQNKNDVIPKGYGQSGTFTIKNDSSVLINRLYDNTLEKMINSNVGDEFTDTNRMKWIKLDGFDFDKNKIYKEIL